MDRSILFLTGMLLLTSCIGAYDLIEPERRSIGDGYTVDPQIYWNSMENGKVETWTIDGPSLQALQFVKGLEHGDILVSTRRSKSPAEFKKDMTPTEIQEYVLDSFHKRGYVQVDSLGLKPKGFGDLEGFWFEMTYVNPHGLDGQGMVAGAIMQDRLHLIIYSGVDHYYTKYHSYVVQLINSIQLN